MNTETYDAEYKKIQAQLAEQYLQYQELLKQFEQLDPRMTVQIEGEFRDQMLDIFCGMTDFGGKQDEAAKKAQSNGAQMIRM
jgi:hypothetical protein